MKLEIKPTKTLIAFAAALTIAAPTAALDIQAPDFDPGPQFDLPGDIAPPQNGGGNGGGNSTGQPAHVGGDNLIGTAFVDPCPNGEMQVSFEMDDDNHPIPTSFSRECVALR
ncbi:hypothetical protein [Gymnodinialimonas hymeniacidonis]|uniref:hypothetical protein n=1 Tax=Gymnodinialimonas hymeniacidonis TaxID=3126508 RepID=UPI0034C6BDAE